MGGCNSTAAAASENYSNVAPADKSAKKASVPAAAAAKSTRKVELHELPISANSLGCMMLCKDNALPVEFINAMGKTRTEEFMAFNPMHCCPTVKDGDHAVWESNVCLRYLAQK